MGLVVGAQPLPLVRDRHHDELAVPRQVGRFDREQAAAGHRVAGVDGQIDEDLLELHRIDPHPAERLLGDDQEPDVLADQPLQHPPHPGDDVVQVQDLRGDDLPARKRQQLPGDLSCRAGSGRGLGQELDAGIAGRRVLEGDLQVGGDRGEQVVEVVRHPSGEPADGLQLLRVKEVGLHGSPFGDVLGGPERPVRRPLTGLPPAEVDEPLGAGGRAQPADQLRRTGVAGPGRQEVRDLVPVLGVDRRQQRRTVGAGRRAGQADHPAHLAGQGHGPGGGIELPASQLRDPLGLLQPRFAPPERVHGLGLAPQGALDRAEVPARQDRQGAEQDRGQRDEEKRGVAGSALDRDRELLGGDGVQPAELQADDADVEGAGRERPGERQVILRELGAKVLELGERALQPAAGRVERRTRVPGVEHEELLAVPVRAPERHGDGRRESALLRRGQGPGSAGPGPRSHVSVVHREGEEGAAAVKVVQGPAVPLVEVHLPGVSQHQERQASRDPPEEGAQLALDGMARHSRPRSRRISTI
jgi:hypothetical protein